MSRDEIYNPLDKRHLADSIARAFFERPIHPLPPREVFRGAGIYAIYYRGNLELYREISKSCSSLGPSLNKSKNVNKQPIPIYIGKSDAPGSRKGVAVEGSKDALHAGEEEADDLQQAQEFLTKTPHHKKLYDRLVKHSKSIALTRNLRIEDFFCRYMLVDEIWVPLGEARLVEMFRPLWNVLIEGFGSNPEGGGRKDTARPVWDILHPGRKEELSIRVDKSVEENLVQRLRNAVTRFDLEAAIAEHRKARIAFNRTQKAKRS